ncbi:MAG: radical SAM protein [Crenarchaeota archaeon]|nr:radical SAM protein [Thermoproteota archaeon]
MRFEVLRDFDPWSGQLCTCPRKYSLQPYTNCPFSCLYCYATSYIKRPFSPKKNFLEKLRRDLKKADRSKFINMSTSSDPYPPIEAELGLTRSALELLREHGFRVLITTKGTLVTRDIELLRGIGAVMMTITTLDDRLARRLEPGAPPPSERVEALGRVASSVPAGVRLDPIIPGVNSSEEEIREMLRKLRSLGVLHVMASTYKAKPDNLRRMVKIFPHLNKLYERAERVGGYRYLPRAVREELLRPVAETARKLGMSYAFCREGIPFEAPSCDGSHLLPHSRHLPST